MPIPVPPPHFEAESYALDEPIVVVHGRGDDARTDCMAAEARTPEATDVLLDLRERGRGLPRSVRGPLNVGLESRRPMEAAPWKQPWVRATWTPAHSRQLGIEPDHDPRAQVIPLELAASEIPRFALDEPILVESGVEKNERPLCFEVRATGPAGEALIRPDRPRVPMLGNQRFRPGSRFALQDFVVVDVPGRWTVRVSDPHVGCLGRDVEAWRQFEVDVLPATLDRTAWDPHPFYWSPVAHDAYRADLERLAHQGVAWAVHGIGGIPDVEATEHLFTLLDHPRADVSSAASEALSYRMPPYRNDAALIRWSEQTWLPEHDARIGAWLETRHVSSGALWEAWNAHGGLDWAVAEAPSGNAGAWRVFWYFRFMGRPVELAPEDHEILDLLDAEREGRFIPAGDVVKALEHPNLGALRVVRDLASECTPELADALFDRVLVGDLVPGDLRVCPPAGFGPVPDDRREGHRVLELDVLEYAMSHLEAQPELRDLLVRWGTDARRVSCGSAPDRAEVARWREAFATAPHDSISPYAVSDVLPGCEVLP